MKTKNIPESIIICILLVLNMINMMPVIGDDQTDPVADCARLSSVGQGLRIAERKSKIQDRAGKAALAGIADSFSRIGYKPVPDISLDDNVNKELRENLLYKKWCEETFDNGNYVYEAYKNIAFNIKYTPEMNKTDFWQTPLETTRLKKGDCEDVVLLFFSNMPADQKNVEIVWGWVIDNRNLTGKAHVWYQLTDRRGMKYIVEGFSNDWNGIIPMEIVQDSETRKPILTISHCMINRLSRLFPEVDNWRMCQTLIDLFKPTSLIKYVSRGRHFSQQENIHLSFSGQEFIEYPADTTHNESWRHTQFLSYSPRREMHPYMNRNIADIMKKLHEVFTRLENQKKKVG